MSELTEILQQIQCTVYVATYFEFGTKTMQYWQNIMPMNNIFKIATSQEYTIEHKWW